MYRHVRVFISGKRRLFIFRRDGRGVSYIIICYIYIYIVCLYTYRYILLYNTGVYIGNNIITYILLLLCIGRGERGEKNTARGRRKKKPK